MKMGYNLILSSNLLSYRSSVVAIVQFSVSLFLFDPRSVEWVNRFCKNIVLIKDRSCAARALHFRA